MEQEGGKTGTGERRKKVKLRQLSKGENGGESEQDKGPFFEYSRTIKQRRRDMDYLEKFDVLGLIETWVEEESWRKIRTKMINKINLNENAGKKRKYEMTSKRRSHNGVK